MNSYPAWTHTATAVAGRTSTVVAYLDGTHWLQLDPATGRPRGQPLDLGFLPARPLQYADLDSDGEPEILALDQSAAFASVVAFATGTGRKIWEVPLKTKFEALFGQGPPPDWPLVVDLDGDGRSEIAVPVVGPMSPGDGYRGVQLIDGASGRLRWVRPMRPETKGGDGLLQILDAPDLDHDGVRDLVTTSFFLGRYPTSPNEGRPPVPERVYVDALSGKDGHPLWWWHKDAATDGVTTVRPMRWWGRGPDGWPLLAIALTGGNGRQLLFPDSPIVYSLEASTGREVIAATGLSLGGVADLDGDRLIDLWGEADGELRAFRGEAPEAWRALDRLAAARELPRWDRGYADPAADLDRDGIADTLIASVRAANPSPNDDIGGRALGAYRTRGFVRPNAPAGNPIGSRTAIARSGRDGHVIWKAELDPRRFWFEKDHGDSYTLSTSPLPRGDLDGNGTPDVIVQKSVPQRGPMQFERLASLPLRLLSGRDGHPLWTAGPLPLGFEAYGDSSIFWVEAVDVESKGAHDLLVRHDNLFARSRSATIMANSAPMPRLARVSGRDGRVLWDIPLSEHPDQNQMGQDPSAGYGDFDRDGALDAVVLLRGMQGTQRPDHELRVVSLREGKVLWSHRIPFQSVFVSYAQFLATDLDGDRWPEILIIEEPPAGEGQAFVLKALDGRDGKILWTWDGAQATGPRDQVSWVLRIGHFEDNGKATVCLGRSEQKANVLQANRLIMLDARGQQIADRELPLDANMYLNFVDVNGDRRDELLTGFGGRIHALDRELKELWSYPAKNNARIENILPASAGRTGHRHDLARAGP